MRRLIVLSCQRSGTNWLQDVARNVPNLYVLRELFNVSGAFGLAAYERAGLAAVERALGREALDERDPEVIAWVRADPPRALARLEDVAQAFGYDGLSLTLFPGQLSLDVVRELLAAPRTTSLLVLRQHLPRYVSVVKAREAGIWRRIDTTDLRPEIAARHFLKEARRAADWVREVVAAHEPGSEPARLRYEEDLLRPPEDVLRRLCGAVPWLRLPPPGAPLKTHVFKQDRALDVFDAVANGAALRAELDGSGELTTAFAYPDA